MKPVLYELSKQQLIMHYAMMISFHSQVASVPLYMIIDDKLDLGTLCRAVESEAERNDCLRLRYRCGMFKWRQYFIPYTDNMMSEHIKTADFTGKTEEEQFEFLRADAKRRLRYRHGEVARFIIFRTHDGKTGIYCNVFHLNCDAMAVIIMFRDILDVYYSIECGDEPPAPLYPYEKKLISELSIGQTERYKAQALYAREYIKNLPPLFTSSPAGMGELLRIRKKKHDDSINIYDPLCPFHDKSGNYKVSLDAELAAAIYKYCGENKISPQTLLYMGYRTYCQAVNDDNPTCSLLVVCDRRRGRDDHRTGGNIMNGSPVTTSFSREVSFADAVSEISRTIYKTYRFTDIDTLSFADMAKKYTRERTSIGATIYMTSIVNSGFTRHGQRCVYGGVPTGRFAIPLYAFAVLNEGVGIDCNYEYKLHYVSDADIRAMHECAVRVIAAGIKNPGINVGELLALCRDKINVK